MSLTGDPLHDKLAAELKEVKLVLMIALEAREWGCGECGNFAPRPDRFTKRRLLREVERRAPMQFSNSMISIGISELIESGALSLEKDLTLRKS